MPEMIVLVDKLDREVGKAEKLDVHLNGLLHRAFSIFTFNSRGELLLQRRALGKYHSGGLWSNACCSHPRWGENLEDAVHRRLKEEMGFDCPLDEIGTYYYKECFDNGLCEHEITHIFKGVYDGDVNTNEEEAEDYEWVAWEDLLDDMRENPQDYSCWLRGIINSNKYF